MRRRCPPGRPPSAGLRPGRLGRRWVRARSTQPNRPPSASDWPASRPASARPDPGRVPGSAWSDLEQPESASTQAPSYPPAPAAPAAPGFPGLIDARQPDDVATGDARNVGPRRAAWLGPAAAPTGRVARTGGLARTGRAVPHRRGVRPGRLPRRLRSRRTPRAASRRLRRPGLRASPASRVRRRSSLRRPGRLVSRPRHRRRASPRPLRGLPCPSAVGPSGAPRPSAVPSPRPVPSREPADRKAGRAARGPRTQGGTADRTPAERRAGPAERGRPPGMTGLRRRRRPPGRCTRRRRPRRPEAAQGERSWPRSSSCWRWP